EFGCTANGCTHVSYNRNDAYSHFENSHQRIRCTFEGCGKTLSSPSKLKRHLKVGACGIGNCLFWSNHNVLQLYFLLLLPMHSFTQEFVLRLIVIWPWVIGIRFAESNKPSRMALFGGK